MPRGIHPGAGSIPVRDSSRRGINARVTVRPSRHNAHATAIGSRHPIPPRDSAAARTSASAQDRVRMPSGLGGTGVPTASMSTRPHRAHGIAAARASLQRKGRCAVVTQRPGAAIPARQRLGQAYAAMPT
jgi:hypothetical protein